MSEINSTARIQELELEVERLKAQLEEVNQAENRMKQQSAVLETLLNIPQEPIYLLDVEGRVISINLDGAEKFNMTPVEMLGRSIYDLMPEPLSRDRRESIEQVMRTGEPARFEDTRQGIHFLNRVYAVPDPQTGGILGAAIFAFDITALKQVEISLRESEERFRQVFENSIIAKSITYPDGKMHVNRAFCEMVGYSEAELADQRWQKLTHPEDVDMSTQQLKPLLAGEKDSVRFTKRYLHKNGSVVWVDISTTLRRDLQGRPLYFMTGMIDISDRKRTEELLHARLKLIEYSANHTLEELLLQALEAIGKFTASPVSFLLITEADQKTITQHACFTHTGQVETLPGKGSAWLDALHQRRPILRNQLSSQPEEQGHPGVHFPLQRELVVPVFHEARQSAVMGCADKLQQYDPSDVEFVATWAEFALYIIERKMAEDRLAERHATLSSLLESFNTPVFSLDRSYCYTSFNQAHAIVMKLLYGAEIQIGRSMYDYQTQPEDRQQSQANLDRALAGEQVIQSAFSGEEGQARRYFEVLHNPIFTPAGEVIGVSVLANDFTERKRAEEILREYSTRLELEVGERTQQLNAVNELLTAEIAERKQAQEALQKRTTQLEATNHELEAFAYSISHDLRSPLRGIDGWSLALMEDYADQLDDQARQYLETVRSEAQRMGQMIDDLLQLSRFTRSEMRSERVDLSTLAQTAIDRLRFAEPGRVVEVVIQPGLTSCGDPILLSVLIDNLLENAWKFTGTRLPARIEFGQTEVDGRLAYFVKDNGVGFNMAYAGKLFGAFQRLHKPSEFPGTGIGLATVQRIVHRQGGQVWVNAIPDQGASFYFTLGEVA